jgi:signal transduction histidine kinase
VTDTGVGIASDNLERIFDKFQQLDSSETRVYGGLGLGLYVAKKLTELLGGKIAVDSVPGRGSIFTVEIPCTV